MAFTTRILPVPPGADLGRFEPEGSLEHWQVPGEADSDGKPSDDLASLRTAADLIRRTDTPVGFPTETVYGLGADVTRSAAVRGIFAAKGRPADNPLIVHVCDMGMLRGVLGGELPAVYRPLVARFWPGPLTILLPVADAAASTLPRRWILAPEVTAGLPTFGARLPASALTRTLIRLADAPLAGPSANASTRPSPTTAQHVVDDLDGRIEAVLDGGPSGVGVESTVVDGLCDPPVVLRPGGISMAELRSVPGWENVQRAYRDSNSSSSSTEAPRAPGMKYKHYSPKARVVLYEGGRGLQETGSLAQAVREQAAAGRRSVGIIRTSTWKSPRGSLSAATTTTTTTNGSRAEGTAESTVTYDLEAYELDGMSGATAQTTVLDLDLGRGLRSVAHGLFSALRDLDAHGAEVILVEGLADGGDDMAAAVMNRLRKAASEVR